ncbi:uncharacterized protein LACBIDRAFT_333480 [Laccaria bicolor S238N-H82]|uniref:Predicted protein n=1 Tax=Laccaria bicolor (strain S238N-H82 / ATCC MYA-4686) TaxID=486041 RepID=B0DW23_LACBS|nr:uncharacterized protein LACBIDRAFT_333480 [Laccaria bicolor S238N-H82]EDR01271.1 predicted protein [Laccaria bicolor S238N-H82]|eukprot:XP_001888147.1 predicted protein [Laccaria bicolor S238N-H82]
MCILANKTFVGSQLRHGHPMSASDPRVETVFIGWRHVASKPEGPMVKLKAGGWCPFVLRTEIRRLGVWMGSGCCGMVDENSRSISGDVKAIRAWMKARAITHWESTNDDQRILIFADGAAPNNGQPDVRAAAALWLTQEVRPNVSSTTRILNVKKCPFVVDKNGNWVFPKQMVLLRMDVALVECDSEVVEENHYANHELLVSDSCGERLNFRTEITFNSIKLHAVEAGIKLDWKKEGIETIVIATDSDVYKGMAKSEWSVGRTEGKVWVTTVKQVWATTMQWAVVGRWYMGGVSISPPRRLQLHEQCPNQWFESDFLRAVLRSMNGEVARAWGGDGSWVDSSQRSVVTCRGLVTDYGVAPWSGHITEVKHVDVSNVGGKRIGAHNL